MSLLRKIGLAISVFGCGMALSRAISFQTMDEIGHPRQIWILAGIGIVGAFIYAAAAIREGNRQMAVSWPGFLAAVLLLTFIIMPPLPTRSLYEQARNHNKSAMYWVQVYNHPGRPPLDLDSGGPR